MAETEYLNPMEKSNNLNEYLGLYSNTKKNSLNNQSIKSKHNNTSSNDDYDIKKYMLNPNDLLKFFKEYGDLYKSAYILEEFKNKQSKIKINPNNVRKKASKSISFLNYFKPNYSYNMKQFQNNIRTLLEKLFDRYFNLTNRNRKLHICNVESNIKRNITTKINKEKESIITAYHKKNPNVIINLNNLPIVLTRILKKIDSEKNSEEKIKEKIRKAQLDKKQEIINKLINEYIYRTINYNIPKSIVNSTRKVNTINSISNSKILNKVFDRLKFLQNEFKFMHRDLSKKDIKLLGDDKIIFDGLNRSSIKIGNTHIFSWKLDDIDLFLKGPSTKMLHYEDFNMNNDEKIEPLISLNNIYKKTINKDKIKFIPNPIRNGVATYNPVLFERSNTI